jgi:hypothetical protein
LSAASSNCSRVLCSRKDVLGVMNRMALEISWHTEAA